MKLPRLYPILDTETLANSGVGVEIAAAAFLEGGAGILQFRHKSHWTREIFAIAQGVARLCREAGAPLVINDRADFAMLLDAGLHLGQHDLTPRDARKLVGSDTMVGHSTHNREQLCTAGGEPVDYVAMGPIFSTSTKQNPDPVVGVEELHLCRPLLDKPLVAIGGITRQNAVEVLRAGADSVAVISGLLPETPTARSIRDRMEEWQQLVCLSEP
ncbi:MAG TPA: thiamine phosphate synthase [Bryobacteraceae bacterium]|jgi:thiamine-phosphate pyrophosphorylase|nr:thiamine phosphate synthase [Bryobacteraceae bacterium]